MKKNYIKKLCICALMAALFVPLEWLASNFGKIVFLDSYQIPISCFPLILISIMLGIRWSVATAIVGSFISQLAMGYGITWTTFLWMIPTVVYALAVAVLYKIFRKNDNRIFLSIILFISAIILSSLNIFASYISNWITSGKAVANLIALFASLKLIGGIIFAVLFAIIIPPIINKIKNFVKI